MTGGQMAARADHDRLHDRAQPDARQLARLVTVVAERPLKNAETPSLTIRYWIIR